MLINGSNLMTCTPFLNPGLVPVPEEFIQVFEEKKKLTQGSCYSIILDYFYFSMDCCCNYIHY